MRQALNIHQIRNRSDMRRMVLTLVWPVVLQNFFFTLMFFTDTLMVGRLGKVTLAAVGIASPMVWSISMVLMATGVGAMAAVARAIGERDSAKAQANAAAAMLLSLIGGGAVCAAGITFAEPLMRLMIKQPDVVLEARFYFATVIAAFPLTLLGTVVASVLRAAGDTRTPMTIGIISNVLNVVGNYALIFGKFGMPEMGLTGAGLATALSGILGGLLLLLHIFSSRSAVRLRLRSFLMVTKKTVWRVVRISLPAAIEPLFVHSGFLMFIKIVALLGTAPMAAHRIAVAIESLGFMAGHAFYTVAATVVGQSLGASRKDLAQMGNREAMKLCVSILSVAALVFLTVPWYLARIFTDDLNLVNLAAICLMISAAEQPLMAMANVFKGTFQGAGDTKTPVIVGALSVWLVRVPLAYLLAIELGMGLVGVWITTAVDWGTRSVIYFFLYRRGTWKETKI